MYNKNVLGMSFHEIGGIAVCGLFIIHKLLNGKWILVITGKLFSKKIAFRCKLNWLIDFLLLVCFTVILISGINISKVVFAGTHGASNLKTAHYAVSALALVLLGIHLGTHYESIVGRIGVRKLPLILRRITAIVLSAAILGFGIYQITATSFLQWMGNLGAVIGTSQALPDGDHEDRNMAEMPDFEGEMPSEIQDTATDETTEADTADTAADALAQTDETTTEFSTGGHGNGPQDGTGKGLGNGNGASNLGAVNLAAIPQVLLSFLSITLAFSVVIAWIDGLHRHAKRKKLLQKAQAQ